MLTCRPRRKRCYARRAREIARQAKTPLVIERDGLLVEIDPDDSYLDEEETEP
jgi:hypothetical protein